MSTLKMKFKTAIRNLRILEVGLRWRRCLSGHEIAALLNFHYLDKKITKTKEEREAINGLIEKRLFQTWGDGIHFSPMGQDLRDWLRFVHAPKNGKKG
jgi:hypothetical protein